MADPEARAAQKDRYAAVIDQDDVTEEVRNVALNYDPLNRSGGEGFHVTEDGRLHIDDEKVIEEHRIVQNRILNDSIRIVRLPAERGQLVHQYGENGFRLYELPAPTEGSVVGLLGPNGVGKSTALEILGGRLKPNLGAFDRERGWDEIVREFRGTAAQNYLERLREGNVRSAFKPQRVDRLPEEYDGSVRALLETRDERDAADAVVERLELGGLLEREVDELSGGELQRVAIAATVVADAETYLIDEPSSYLDVGQRLSVARLLEALADERRVVVVDHDLVTLDLMADAVHLLYGEPGGFGVVSRPLSTRRGINQFLEGYLRDENVRIREDAVDFLRRSDRSAVDGEPVAEFPTLTKEFRSFSLRTEAGTIYPEEVLGILGRNGLGKTTFAKMIAGVVEPDGGTVERGVRISYKPQHVAPSFEGTVRELFGAEVDVRARRFGRLERSFDVEPLYERGVDELSGGELQRVSIALALARNADVYLLDEPSAYLDVDRRMSLATQLRAFVEREGAPCLVIDHDLLLLNYVSDRTMVFEGEPGRRGIGRSPGSVREGIDRFLETVDVTFRRDPNTGRPRANKPGSRKDREQKRSGEYYAG
jgi:ATP-binding cassette, sub-family E, member 1